MPSRSPRPTPPAPAMPPEVVDPLAALRDPEDLEPVTGPTSNPPDPEANPELETPDDGPGMLLVTQDEWDNARKLAVVAMHSDTTAIGFLHKGRTCGCSYIAGVVLGVALPVHTDDDPDPDGQD